VAQADCIDMKYNPVIFIICLLLFILVPEVKAQQDSTLHKNLIYRLVAMSDSFEDASKKRVQYRHYFTYDQSGRLRHHQWDYWRNGKFYSSNTMKYLYNFKGRLVEKSSDQTRYRYFYDQNERLVNITLHLLHRDKWVLFEETTLEERKDTTAGGKVLLLTMNKRKVSSMQLGRMENYCKKEYLFDSSHNVTKVTFFSYVYKRFKEPKVLYYQHDDKLNPLQNLFIERWYEFDLDHGGMNNLTGKSQDENCPPEYVYEYNECGYPVRCVINENRLKTFKYEVIATSLQN
jgi:YD repeat-containing protein